MDTCTTDIRLVPLPGSQDALTGCAAVTWVGNLPASCRLAGWS